MNRKGTGYGDDGHAIRGTAVTDKQWYDLVKGLFKAEMKRRHLTYEGLSAKLAEIGVNETPRNLRNKVSRGGFAAIFMVQCFKAMGAKVVRIEDE